MTYMGDINQRDLNTINDFIALHNNNMEVINSVFNKLIAASNRQNKKIFWLNMGIITLGVAVYRMANKLFRAQEQIDGLSHMIARETETTEEK